MRVAIIGAAGMVGTKLANRLAKDGQLAGKAISGLAMVDVTQASAPPNASFAVETLAADMSDQAAVERLIAGRPDLIFNLAAIVSGQAEQNFELGYRINMDGLRLMLEAIRRTHLSDGYMPRLVFTSSIAVFGSPFPEQIDDTFHQTPLTSYGTQKAICELLLSDYSRKGYVDGVAIRLPTICVRPGLPNLAASGFFSNIIREPLVGKEAVLPVPDTVRHWHASPRSAIGFLLHAAGLDTSGLGASRAITMPGLSCTVAEQIEALREVAGEAAVALIRREPNEQIGRIVAGWPQNFDAARATALGFDAEKSFADIIRVHLEDELGQKG